MAYSLLSVMIQLLLLFKDQLDMDKEGYLLTKPDSTETNIPGVLCCW